MTLTPLVPLTFTPLPTTATRPMGWLAQQLRIQADGLSGHLDEFWPDIKDSKWFGGSAEGWERAPYWLDGVIPLAYLLDDAALKERVNRYMDYILTHQQDDGWIGPAVDLSQPYDLWAILLGLKVLVEYHHATGDARIQPAVEKALRNLETLIDTRPLFNWGHSRWFEGLIAVFWLYERTGEEWLYNLAVKLQAQGFHWGDFFKRYPFTQTTPKWRWNYMSHVVNNAMAVKAHALWYRLTGDAADQAASHDILAKLDRYHGMVTGMFSGDECLAGKKPTQGTELCAVVEYAYSLEHLLAVFGEARYGDRLEQVIFNALPATFSPDMWAHQYDQQVNQVECSINFERTWVANGPDANLFGLEPNYGCCTANLSQGWPKFAAHLWMRSTDNGLAAVAYAPSQVETTLSNTPVHITLETDYPFRDLLRFTVSTPHPVVFPLHLRIPAWAEDAVLAVGSQVLHPTPGSFFKLEREWTGEVQVDLRFPMHPELKDGFNDAIAIQRGPLLYALRMGEDWRQVNADLPYHQPPHADYEVHPVTPWNYALHVTPASLEQDVIFLEHPIGDMPFSPEGAPVTAHVNGARLPGWVVVNGSADDAPISPVSRTETLEMLTLIPYGCTNLRVTEFPRLSG